MDLTEEISIHFWDEIFLKGLNIFEAIKLYQVNSFFRELILDLIRRNKVKKEDLYVFGNNNYGQLGLGNRNVQINIIQNHFFDQVGQIKQIVLGGAHSIVLMENGNLYVFGQNRDDRLGLNNKNNQLSPVRNHFFDQLGPIKQIVLGGHHSMVLLENRDLYVFGSNFLGQLGLGNRDLEGVQIGIIQNHFFDQLGLIKEIILGWNNSMVLLENEDLYVFGWNSSGQLGLGNRNLQLVPIQNHFFDQLSSIKQIVSGKHSMVLLENGDLYVFGSNDYGQLGLGNRNLQLLPIQNNFFDQLSPITEIILGADHSIILLDNGDLYVFGMNDYGQLGLDHTENQLLPARNHFFDQFGLIKQIVSGSRDSMVLMNNNDLYVFGYNKFGQLGLGNIDNQLLPVQNNFFDQFDSIEEIILGAGHSMVLVDEPI